VKAEWVLPLEDTLDLVRARALESFGEEREGLLLVATGGEPSLQLDEPLSRALRERGYRIAMESNGSREIDRSLVDWLTISPKQAEFAQKEGDELKILYTGGRAPGPGASVEAVRALSRGTRFSHHFLQPIDLPDDGGPNYGDAVAAVMELGPPWRLSVQTHKVLEIP
jgi:7-carboxy-7-deazaguanine synthase